MKQRLLQFGLAFLFLGLVPILSAQETSSFDAEFASIDNELVKWDPIRGKWLGNSLKAMSSNQPIPDRTFPEDFSPAEMMRLVPNATMNNVRTISQNQSQNSRDLLARERWARVYNYTNRPTCNLVMGRTYGDPHLKSFDGASYSFQTVGEFVLASANNNSFEVQVRQEPQRDDFSLNTAIAMQVGGDRLGIYARDKRDAFNSPVMLNGMPIAIGSSTYYLPHGGTIRNSGKNYLVTWPTGETVSVDMSRTGGMSFMNIAVQVYPCASNRYAGLLGNANGDRSDDFNTGRGGSMSGVFASSGTMSQEMEKERLSFLAKDFANVFRINPQTSLFDYGFGESTATFTDYSYPRVHRTIHDIPVARQTTARNTCSASGLRGDDLEACIYDQAFLEIEPVRPPVIRDRTEKVNLPKVDREIPNVNKPNVAIPSRDIPEIKESRDAPNGAIMTKPMQTDRNIHDVKTVPTVQSKTERANPTTKWESREVNERHTESVVVKPKDSNPTSSSRDVEIKKETPVVTNPQIPARTSPTPRTKPEVRKTSPAQTPVKKEIKKPATSPAPTKSKGESGETGGIKRGG